MTLKALERIGYNIDSEETEITIHVEKQNWTLKHSDRTHKANRLSDIIRLVRKYGEQIKQG
jgi:hypothetical protein